MIRQTLQEEVATWIHPNRTKSRDGIPGYAFGFGELMSLAGPLETRPSASDVPFAAAFDDPENLARAVREITSRGVPLWHLGLANTSIARAVGHPEDEQILYGAYPKERSPEAENPLWETVARHDGRRLPAAGTHRIWGSRFYPSGAAGDAPRPGSVLLPLEGLGHVLSQVGEHLGTVAVQGSVSRAGQVLLLAFGHEASGVSELGRSEERALLGMVREQGGRGYRIKPAAGPASP